MKAVFTSIHLEECEAFVEKRKGNLIIGLSLTGRYVVYDMDQEEVLGLGGE